MYRFFGRFMRSINHSWQLFFVGMAFWIGFDTATEVVLLTATVYAATSGLPFYAVLAMPLLFAGGMTLRDFVAGFDINKAGFTIAGLFAVVWACALALWRFGNIESRWDSGGPAAPPA